MTSHQVNSQAGTLPATTAERFDADVVEASRTRPVVVDFWAPWCAPCHQLAPIVERVAARFAGQVDAVKLNIESARQALLEVFAVLGDDHELTQRARPRLARALY